MRPRVSHRLALLASTVLGLLIGPAAIAQSSTAPQAEPAPPPDLAAWQTAGAARKAELMAGLDARIDGARQRNGALSDQVAANAASLTVAREQLETQAGDLKPLFAIVRQAAADAASLRRDSLVAAQFGLQLGLADRVSAAGYVPSIGDLRQLQRLYLEEMRESGRVVRFDGTVVSPQGIEQPAEVVRVGAFTLVAGGRFLAWDPGTSTLQTLIQQPRARHRALAAAMETARDGTVPMAVDPTLGAMLDLLARQPSVLERVQQGGAIGYVIITLGAVGLGLALWRFAATAVTASRVRRQLKAPTADPGNPLGRVLRVYEQNPGADTAVLELHLDEAILRETPRLEQWQGAIKAIAAVAPLLGLLGTVTGMIETFQAITLAGSGDPRLMAGGISQALMTTVLGLAVAIPLVLLHTAIAGRSRALLEILEAQSAGIIARRAEFPEARA